MYEEIYAQAKQACNELCDVAKLKEGSIVVIGCSSSEVCRRNYRTQFKS